MKHLLWLVLISSAFGQIGTNGTTANPVPVTCISGCSGGGSSTANQGTPNTFANAWPVELTDGTNLLGTPSFPVRTDPTGTTPQPVTGTFFQATQPVSGTVAVSNFPATQPVSGSVSVSNFPATQNVAVTSALPAGANVIGHVITDTGSTTAVTGNVTVIQGTGTNLHTVVDSGTTAISGTVTTAGAKTNNNAAPGATNLGVLPALANAATPSWSEGNQVAASTDLNGAVRTAPGVATLSTTTWTTATATGTRLTIATLNYPTSIITVLATTAATGGTCIIEGSTDGGATFPYPLPGITQGGNTVTGFVPATPSGQSLTLNTGFGLLNYYNSIGFDHISVRLTASITGAGASLTVGLSGSAVSTLPSLSAGTSDTTSGGTIVRQATASNLNATVSIAAAQTLATVTTVSTVSASRTVGSSGGTMDASGNAAASPANGLLILQRYNTTAPAPTNTQSTAIQADDSGDQFVRNFRRSQYKVQATTISSSSAATTVVSAQAASTFADITSLIGTCTGTATNTATTITLSDGTFSAIFDYNTGATTTFTPATPLVIPFNPPIPATTAATAWTIALSSSAITCHFTVGFVANKAN